LEHKALKSSNSRRKKLIYDANEKDEFRDKTTINNDIIDLKPSLGLFEFLRTISKAKNSLILVRY